MIESRHIYPWNRQTDERIASTLDIRSELGRVKPYSFEEYALCFEAAKDKERPLSPRERYLLARYGREYVDSPDKYNQKLDDLEQRLARNVGKFALIQQSPTFVFIVRIASPNLTYNTYVSNFGDPYGSIFIEKTSSTLTIVDDRFEIVPELTDDFVHVSRSVHAIEMGTTRKNVIGYETDNPRLDPEKPFEHEGTEYVVRLGMGEIIDWQVDNLDWAEHVDNMIEAWNTRLINYPVARKKPFESALDWIK